MLDIDITHVIEYYLLRLNIITRVYNVEINVKIVFFNNRVTNVNNYLDDKFVHCIRRFLGVLLYDTSHRALLVRLP